MGTSVTSVLLAINRMFEIVFPEAGKIIFQKHVTFIWLLVPPCYMIFYFFYIPGIYNTVENKIQFDPFYRVPGVEGNEVRPLLIVGKKFMKSASNLVHFLFSLL